ncbi:hypothetical protein C0033_24825 [Clostridium sp. chh4-2]|uniref:oligosaccharide flippase family protein n=1 Tax=Clostridium sp. chh4-2 TaxID=2067550 RepID=UPI000CCF83E6|nr:oligosaccharide flippase family protein [Clostridium sp. chh4-2]PNV59287.1 hypothetical protein C0033_24825 [Clostridium sp. chh4-2]
MASSEKTKYLMKNTGILTVTNFSSKILIFLLVPLYTSVLSTEDYGIYELVIATIHLLFPVLTLNICDATMRFAMDKGEDKESIVSCSFKIIVCGSAVMGLLLLGNHYLGLWRDILNYEIFIFLYYVSYVFNQFTVQLAKGLEKVKQMGIAGVVGTIATIVFNVLFLLVFDFELPGFFLAYTIGQMIPTIYLAIVTRVWKNISFTVSKETQHKMVVYAVPLIATYLGWWVNSGSDKYVVALICGVASSGLLSVAYKIPQIINTLHQIFIQAWQLSAIKEMDSKDSDKFYQKTFIYLNAIMCGVCSLLILGNRMIAHFLFAKGFFEAWQYVPFLLVSSVINSSAGHIGAILIAKKDSKSLGKSALIGAVCNIVLNVFLVYLIGIQGATIATVISSVIIYVSRRRSIGEVIISVEYPYVIFSWLILFAEAIIDIYFGSYLFTGICVIGIIIVYRKSFVVLCKKCIVFALEFLKHPQ